MLVRNDKYSIAGLPQTSNTLQQEAPQRYQHRDQLSPDNETRVWTADEAKTPCEGQLGSEYSPEMQ